ncbi:LysR family transcriptional regulator [Pseudoroseomonas wenyumeiae]
MHLPMDDVQAFVQVAELGSFTRAADRLALTQTGLTRRIQRLEALSACHCWTARAAARR